MNGERTILDMFGVDLAFLTQVVQANPSLRGVIGYLAERKLWDIFANDSRVTTIRKDDDHDRENKGDLVVTYQGFDFRLEVKSLQTNSISMYDDTAKAWMKKVLKIAQPRVSGRKRQRNKWQQCELYRNVWISGGSAARFKGQVQCDASDKRDIDLSNGTTIRTTNLKVGEFDFLAMGLFAFRERWDFGYMLNRDLPRSTHKAYPAEDRQHLLKTLIPVEWPLPAGCRVRPVHPSRSAGGRTTTDETFERHFVNTIKYEWFLRACSCFFSRLTPARFVRTTTNKSFV